MADDPITPVDDKGSPAQRVRDFVARTRQVPATVEGLTGEVTDARTHLEQISRDLDGLAAEAAAGRADARRSFAARAAQLRGLADHLETLGQQVSTVDGAVAGHAAALHRAIVAPARQAAARALADELGPTPTLRPGLSIFTLCWNHGELLADSVRSALAVLDRLEPHEQGQVLVLDDASTDGTAAVAATLAQADGRVRVIRAPLNLGLALARTTLLHATETAHAFHLDADNTASPDGVVALYRAAVATGAALTYGTVVQVGTHDEAIGPVSNEPPTPALFASNYIDTMAITDVAVYRRLGGWSSDPLLEHVDDWWAVLRVAGAGLLVVFVPTVAGRYRKLQTAFHLSVADPRIGASRVARVMDPTGRRQGDGALDGVAAMAFDPVAGPLWATPEAIRLRPDLTPPPAPARLTPRPSRRILVMAPGGVANLGDDAITVRGLERLRAALADSAGRSDDIAIDLVTDGTAPPPGRGPVRWLGVTLDVLGGLRRDELGSLDLPLEQAVTARQVGGRTWRPFDPSAYAAALFLGGGSLTSDWSDGLIAPRALLAAALRTAGVPYACSGQGIGPLETDDDQALVAGLLAGAVAVSCRDGASADLARGLAGVDPARVSVTGDDALDLSGAQGVIALPDRPVLGVTLRRAGYVSDSASAWARAADAIAAEHGWDVLGIAVNAQGPEPEIATLAQVRATIPRRSRWHLVECGPDPRHLVGVASRVQAMAAQSYHAALFALAAGAPTVLGAATPYYADKAHGLARLAGLPDALAVADPADLAPALDAVTAALSAGTQPLAAAAAATAAWWDALPSLLGVTRPASA